MSSLNPSLMCITCQIAGTVYFYPGIFLCWRFLSSQFYFIFKVNKLPITSHYWLCHLYRIGCRKFSQFFFLQLHCCLLAQLKPQGHKWRLSTNPHLCCGCWMLHQWAQPLEVQAKKTSKQVMWNKDFLLTVIPLKSKYSPGMLECWFSCCVRTATTDFSLPQLVHLMLSIESKSWFALKLGQIYTAKHRQKEKFYPRFLIHIH